MSSVVRRYHEIIEVLESDKVKQRKEGVDSFREFLSIKSNFDVLKADRSVNWTQTLQSLFHLVILERNAVAVKATAPAQARLEAGAELVAWTAERVHLLLTKKGVKALFNHLIQLIAVGGIVQVYALFYLRALHAMLSHPPHLEHLDERQWTDIVTMCFGGALGDKVRVGQELEDAEAMDVDENGRRKRALRVTSDDERQPTATRRTANPIETEMLRCIEMAFRSKSAPFLPYSRIIFTKFHRFLRQFTADTTAHLPALTALNLAFAELDLNDQLAMRELGGKLWSHVLALWATKSAALKEQVVMALRYLLPFVSPSRDPAHYLVEPRLKALYEAVLSEPTLRSRESLELHVDQLRLGLEEDGGAAARRGAVNETRAFYSTTFRIGNDFTDKQAMAWAVLELGADSLARIHDLSDMATPAPNGTPEGSGRNKRRKVEEPLAELVSSLSDASLGITVLVFRVQLLLFLVERHWTSLHLNICQRILSALLPFLSQGDPQLQSWAFLVVASIGHHDLPISAPNPQQPARERKGSQVLSWDHIWTLALRKIANPDLSRVAAHTANVLLAHDRVSPGPLATAIETLAKDLDVQGPNFPTDAVCTFLEWCIVLASSDVRLYRLRLSDKVFAWITNAWKPLDGLHRPHSIKQARPRSDPFSPSHLVSLIARVCNIDRAPRLPYDYVVPDCPIASMALDQCETAALRDYIDAKVPSYSREETTLIKVRTPESVALSASGGAAEDLEHTMERRISVWLQRLLERLAGDGDEGVGGGIEYWSVMTLETTRRHLDLASVALVVEGFFTFHKRREGKATIKAAADILSKLAPTIGLSKWSPLQRAFLLSGLSPIFVPLPDYPSVPYPVLIDPGPASDLPRHLLPQRHRQSTEIDFASFELVLLQTLWRETNTQAALEEISSVLTNVLSGATNPNEADDASQAPQVSQASQRLRKAEKTEQDDDFGEIKVASRAAQILGPAGQLRAGMATMAATLRGLISGEMARSGTVGSVRVQEVIDAIVEADGAEAIVIAEQTFSAVRAGLVSLSVGQADELLQHLGGELLPDYRFARDERFALLGLKFLECTASMWINVDDSDAAADLSCNARILCAWYTNSLHRQILASWRVRLRFTAFLDVYLSFDSTQELWDRGGQAARSAACEVILPTGILPSMLSDRDFRVRFRASSSAPGLFAFLHVNDLPAPPLFADIKKHVETNLSEFEKVLTQIICHANIMIVSASRRRAPYNFLLARVCADAPEYIPQTEAVLQGAAERLGLNSLTDLYHLYARYATQLHYGQGERTPEPLPFRVCGYTSLRDARVAEFRQTASFWLSHPEGQGAYQKLCDVTKQSYQAGAVEAFPEAAALTLAKGFARVTQQMDQVENVEAEVEQLAALARCGDAYQVGNLFASLASDIAAELLSLLYEKSWPAAGGQDGLHPSLVYDPKLAQAFKAILALQDDIPLIEATPLYFDLPTILAALDWLERKHTVFAHPSTLFAVVHELLHRVHLAPFVDFQRSKLFALALALALGGRHTSNPTILGLLTESLVVLLPQPDLASLVVGMLEWSLQQWLSLGAEVGLASGADLSANLVRAAHACKKLLDTPGTPQVYDLANALGEYLGKAVDDLVALHEPTVTEAYLLWPWSLIETSSLPLEALEGALSTSFAPVGKFSVVQALKDRQDFADSPKRGLILWRLMESLSSSTLPETAGSLALADLLYEAGGVVDAPALDQPGDLPSNGANARIEDDGGIRLAIVAKVLDCLHHPAQALVHKAFGTARLLFSVPSASTLFSIDNLPRTLSPLATILSDKSLLRPSRLRTRATRRLEELKKDHRWLDAGKDYSRWVSDFVRLLADCCAESEPFYAQLDSLALANPTFAASILPHLVHSILFQAANAADSATRKQLSEYLGALLRNTTTSVECLSAIVDLAASLRRHPRPDLADPLSNSDMWLDIPWTLLAEGAVKTGAYLTSLLFIELAHEYDGLFKPKEGGQAAGRQLDNRGQEALYAIYAKIDEPDGFYGRQSSDVRKALVRRYHHENRWSEAFGVHGAEFESQDRSLSSSSSIPTAGVVQSLASFGFKRLAMSILAPARAEGGIDRQDIDAGLPYELAWRTDTWDVPVERNATSTSSASLYSALRAVHGGREAEALETVLNSTMVSEVGKLSTVTLDLPRPDIDAVSTVLALREVRRLATLKLGDQLDPALTADLHRIPPSFNFHQADHILSTRISILRGIRAAEQADAIGDDFATALYRDASNVERACLVSLSAAARDSGHLQASMNAVTLANKLVETGSRADDVDEELAKVLWAQGEHSTAIALLESLSGRGLRKKALIWARLGEWMTEARLRSSREVLDGSFEPAARALDASYSPTERSQVFSSFAVFADNQYQDSFKAMQERKKRFETYRKRKEHELSEIQRQLQSGRDSGASSHQLERSKAAAQQHLDEDARQLADAVATANNMLQRALENYANALAESNEHDDKVLRFVALWLAHSDDDHLNKSLAPLVKTIPSHKFVFLAYQLSARISKPTRATPFSETILKLVTKLCTDHPFHSIFPVDALRDTAGSSGSSRGRRSSTAPSESNLSNRNRAQAANEVIDKVKRVKTLVVRVEAIELACEAYREWADVDLRAKNSGWTAGTKGVVKKGLLKITPSAKILTSVRKLPIPVTSFNLPVDPTCTYDPKTFPTIVRYRDVFENAGGINMPKIMWCIGDDGVEYKQLLKGNDDIRQDAVMEQVFTLVNTLLASDESTRRRKLHIRTYKVVPLQNATGLIEFVKDTRALGSMIEPLYESLPSTYLRPREARKRMQDIVKTSDHAETLAAKDAAFKKILARMPPMMRHLFHQQHKTPSLWFDMRLNYSRSVATTSIIGHIIGLGDRHVSNILMDTVKGELVAIDLGVAFDQGKRLPVPELIPFRLTQNLVDAFGHSGVEGVFRRCAEETLRVLRSRSNVLLTVLEVLKHDPLQNWAVSAAIVRRVQGSESRDVDSIEDLPDDADRALHIVSTKLDTKLSVAYTVNQLIQEATDVQNLGRIFHGWQPYL